jgi:hypothetical protein
VNDALASVQIEGVSLTRVRAAERAEAAVDAGTDEEQEVLNYYAAFNAIDGLRGQRDYVFGARDVQNIHGLMVRGVRGHQHGGRFRTGSVVIGDRDGATTAVHHEPPAAEEAPALVDELMRWIEAAKSKRPTADTWLHPVVVAGSDLYPWVGAAVLGGAASVGLGRDVGQARITVGGKTAGAPVGNGGVVGEGEGGEQHGRDHSVHPPRSPASAPAR